jgi:hypothetical protein
MAIEDKLARLRTEIINNFPTVQEIHSERTIVLIRYIQAYLIEIFLQINRVLISISLLEHLSSDDNEKKFLLENLAGFCMAMSLVGKSRLKVAMINHGIDDSLCKSLDLILKQIYDANSYLDPSKKLSDSDYEKGLITSHQCSDPAEEATYAFKPYHPGVENSKFLAICSISPAHMARTNAMRKEFDPTYQGIDSRDSSSNTPLYSSVASSSSSSSKSQPYKANFSSATDSLFAGAFTNKKKPESIGKKECLEQPFSPTKNNGANLSARIASKRTLSVMLTRGMFPNVHPKKLFLVKTEDPQPSTQPKYT